MLSPEMKKLVVSASYAGNYPMRAIAAYYKNKPKVHPNPSLTEIYYVPRDPGADMSDYLEYVRLANENEILAVFRVTNRGELKRLKRWPQSVEDGTAETQKQLNDWYDSFVAECEANNEDVEDTLSKIIDGLEGVAA